MKVNLNAHIRVKLTPAGAKRWLLVQRRYDAHVTSAPRGVFTMQLWDFMSVFGPTLYMGCEVPTLKNEIELLTDQTAVEFISRANRISGGKERAS